MFNIEKIKSVHNLQDVKRKRIHCTLSEKDILILESEATRLDISFTSMCHSVLHHRCLELEQVSILKKNKNESNSKT